MTRNVKKRCIVIVSLIALALAITTVVYLVYQAVDHCNRAIDRYIWEVYHTPYRGRFDWTEILDEWSDDELPLGTMEAYLKETENLAIYTEEMAVYDKAEMVDYLENSRLMIQMPSGMTYPGPLSKELLELHRDWPIEVILRGEDSTEWYNEGKQCIDIIYKVRDEEGKIEYLHVVFADNYGPSKFDESQCEYGTDESGQAIWKRVEDEKERWCLKNYDGYYFSTCLE